MTLFVTHRHSPLGRAGIWLYADDEGEPLFRVELRHEGRKLLIRRTSSVGIPFSTMADYIVQPGAVAKRRRDGTFGSLSSREAQNVIDTFQRDNEDLIEEIMEEKRQAADPALPRTSTIIVPDRSDANE